MEAGLGRTEDFHVGWRELPNAVCDYAAEGIVSQQFIAEAQHPHGYLSRFAYG
jgi:hypothetical protein